MMKMKHRPFVSPFSLFWPYSVAEAIGFRHGWNRHSRRTFNLRHETWMTEWSSVPSWILRFSSLHSTMPGWIHSSSRSLSISATSGSSTSFPWGNRLHCLPSHQRFTGWTKPARKLLPGYRNRLSKWWTGLQVRARIRSAGEAISYAALVSTPTENDSNPNQAQFSTIHLLSIKSCSTDLAILNLLLWTDH